MDTTEILLGKSKHKFGVNEDNFIDVDLTSYERLLPRMDETGNVDSYIRYFEESDASEKYRFAFTITPFCSNVLFNIVTEPVYREGASDAVAILSNGPSGTLPYSFSYKRFNTSNGDIDRKEAVRDTSCSHSAIGPVVYHCGYDIFNNHYLRKKGFIVVNKNDGSWYFNTIEDIVRDRNGNAVQDNILRINGSGNLETGLTTLHLYQFDTIFSYEESFMSGLTENNGWFGFLNPVSVPVNNIGNNSVNKCMNNNKAWEQIDMYPDRSLYSFVPKINKFRGRIENNWDYCLTYAFSSTTANNEVEGNGVNGLRCKIVSDVSDGDKMLSNEDALVTFKSFVKHNLQPGEYVTFSFMNGSTEKRTANPARVISVGNNGYDGAHCFSVRFSSILNEFMRATSDGRGSTYNPDFSEIRFRKYEAGAEVKYYIRILKKIPNVASSLNKLAFAQNVYSDQVAQIVFTDDVVASGLTDNLGRPVSEIFLTIVKRNKGYEKWYSQNNFNAEDIEFSHAFGKVTSGFDFSEDDGCKDYNVHRIHNVTVLPSLVTPSPAALENGITIDNDTFLCDITEFSVSRLQETSLEPVYHRFNTAQRETTNDEYGTFTYDEIVHDDYDINEAFSVQQKQFTERGHVNIVPEGYYYQAHYCTTIREFEPEVQQGNHILVKYSSASGSGRNWKLNTVDEGGNAKNYYFEPKDSVRGKDGSKVYAYKIYNDKISQVVTGECTSVEGDIFNEVTIGFGSSVNLNDGRWRIYRVNTEMPAFAYELNDGTGRYMWRNVLSHADMTPDDELYNEIFTNGAHYFHRNIMFYLRRQDPYGTYGIGLEPCDLGFPVYGGTEKEISQAEYVEEGEGSVC